MTLSSMLAALLLAAAAVAQATLTASSRPLKEGLQHQKVVSLALSSMTKSSPEQVDLRSSPSGPKTLAALKMALQKTDKLPVPDALWALRRDKEGMHKFVEISFAALLDASQSQWLLSPEELQSLTKRFQRKVLSDMIQDTMKNPRLPPKEFVVTHWQKARKTFSRAIFEDEKQMRKPEFAELQSLGVTALHATKDRGLVTGPFSVLTGDCQVDTAGCVMSPNFPQNYSNRGACIIAVDPNATGPLSVAAFNTEPLADTLTVNGITYTGNVGPEGVWPQEDMVWFSDYVWPAEGWKLCPTPPLPPGQPKGDLHPKTHLSVAAGNCTVDAAGCAMSTNYPDNYPDSDYCEINVSSGGQTPLHVEHFATESLYDYMTVNNEKYSGDLGPEGVVPVETIKWQADYAYGAAGWKICPREASPDLGISNNSVFYVRVGDCVVGADGCVSSPGFPDLYMDSSVCTIGVNTENAGPIQVVAFDTEINYDALEINGMRFSGTNGPVGLVPYEDILWYADFEAAAQGWKICSGAKEAEALPTPTEPENTSLLTLVEGDCIVDGECATSPNYPALYTNSDTCLINVSKENEYPLRVLDFVTENQLDMLIVNGKAYSGIAGPDGVVPEGQIEWVTDAGVRAGGWRVCLAIPEEQTTTTSMPPDTTTRAAAIMTTSSTTTQAPLSTTTGFVPAPAIGSPWDGLAYHMEIANTLTDCLLSLQARAGFFRKIMELRWKQMQGDMFSEDSPMTVFSPEDLFETAESLNSTALSFKIMEPWLYFEEGLLNASDKLVKLLKPSGGLWLETLNRTRHDVDVINAMAVQFTFDSMNIFDELGREGATQMEGEVNFMGFKVLIRSFRRYMAEFLEVIFARFNVVPRFLKDEIEEPLEYVGKGTPMGGDGLPYRILQGTICESIFWCAKRCHKLEEACAGFGVSNISDCTQCQIYITESGFQNGTGYNARDFKYEPFEAERSADGPIRSLANMPGSDKTSIYRRLSYNYSDWNIHMKTTLSEERRKLVQLYEDATETWMGIIGDVKAVWSKTLNAMLTQTERTLKEKEEKALIPSLSG